MLLWTSFAAYFAQKPSQVTDTLVQPLFALATASLLGVNQAHDSLTSSNTHFCSSLNARSVSKNGALVVKPLATDTIPSLFLLSLDWRTGDSDQLEGFSFIIPGWISPFDPRRVTSGFGF